MTGRGGRARAGRRAGTPWQGLAALVWVVLFHGMSAAAEGAWQGTWNSYWRDGAALLVLEQEGAGVTGRFSPGEGRVEGTVRGALLELDWQVGAATGTAVFALSADGRSFTGRFASGEYWNGSRVGPDGAGAIPFGGAGSPREVLRSVVTGVNLAIHGGDIAGLSEAVRHLSYMDGAEDERERRRRRRLLWTLIDLSTFRIYDAPVRVEGDRAVFRIGPDGAAESFALDFQRVGPVWFLVVPREAELRSALDRMVAALGAGNLAEIVAARADSPRGTMRRFLQGMRAWDDGGAEQALAALDLSFLAPQLREIEAPLLADYLKQVIDRAGYVVWQEIPDDPGRPTPYVHYRHPAGAVVLSRVADAGGGPPRWLFSAETVQGAPDLFNAVQALPAAEEIGPSAPVTRFFRLREAIRAHLPGLLERRGRIELWQWGALVGALGLALLAGWAAGRGVSSGLAALARGGDVELRADLASRFDWPVRLAATGVATVFAFGWLGLAQTLLAGATLAVTFATTLVLGWLAYRVVQVAGAHLARRAERSPGYVDEIVVSLVTGILKLTIVALTLVAVAETVGLPYEGVIAGLGVGGIAVAFAARETVSNMIGGAILMSDRPFKRGDLVETEAGWANVETVGLRSTRMRTLDDALLIIPNAKLTDTPILNWGRRRRRQIRLLIGVTYDTPRPRIDAFVEALRNLYLRQEHADASEIYVGLKAFGASSIDIELWGYFRVDTYTEQVAAQHALIAEIVDLAAAEGVSFAFPTRTVHVVPAVAAAGEAPARPVQDAPTG